MRKSVLPACISVSAERLAIMSAEIRSQLLELPSPRQQVTGLLPDAIAKPMMQRRSRPSRRAVLGGAVKVVLEP